MMEVSSCGHFLEKFNCLAVYLFHNEDFRPLLPGAIFLWNLGMAGTTSKKGSKYRKDLLEAVGEDPSHPINQGIHMEAHHLVSSEGVKLSGMVQLLKDTNYNINVVKNLVFLPATLPGACHLEVQVHRGDHYCYEGAPEEDDDDLHPRNYHLEVRDMVKRMKKHIKKCDTDCQRNSEKAQKIMNKLSQQILEMIADYEVPLSPVYKSFKNGQPVGCKNVINIKEHAAASGECAAGREHEGEEHPKFKSGKYLRKITRPNASKRYHLRVGK